MTEPMTEAECIAVTEEHIGEVREFLNLAIIELSDRSIEHDASKLEEPELSVFREYTPKLADTEYGSDKYWEYLRQMKPALEHHYANNRHHPEYFKKGWREMNLMDLIEMLCDWMAASKRHNTGDVYKSLEYNQRRFKMPVYLMQILKNTVDELQVLAGEEDKPF